MYKLQINPDRASYSVKDGNEVVMTQLDGGAGRYRADILKSSFRVTVQWTTDVSGFNYLMAFFRTATKKGSLPFTADLLIEEGGVFEEYTCYFVPNTFQRIGAQSGLSYTASAELEVLPNATDEVADEGLLLFFGSEIETAEDAEEFFNLLEELVNVDLPGVFD